MLYRKIRWKYRYGYYKKKLKKNAKVYSLKTLVLIKKRIKARIKKILNSILKKKKKFSRRVKPKKKKKVLNIKKLVKLPKTFKKRFSKRVKYPKKFKTRFSKPKTGVVKVTANRRNIFATLSTSKGRLVVTVSTGILNVKGKERQATHIIRATANLLIKKIRRIKFNQIIYIIQGTSTRRKKKLFYDTLRRVRQIKIKKVIVAVPRAHNGCRPSKKRRL
jgi:ribosomal protein S11